MTSAAPATRLSPRRAVQGLRPGRECPVCADRLAAFEGGVRCDRCNLVVRELPSVARAVLAFLVVLGAGAALGWYALPHVDEQGPRAAATFGAIALAAMSPWIAWSVARSRWRAASQAIAAVRAHWADTGGIAVDTQRLLDASAPGNDCPVCGRAQLEGADPGLLFSRARLRCPRCRLDVAPELAPVGFALAVALAAALVLAGGWILVHAREAAGNELIIRAGLGAGLAALGLYAGFALQSTGDEIAREELGRSKRRVERIRRGFRVFEDDVGASWFQENLEGVVVAVILFLVVRHFVLELFVIPTGSMAPTLLGNHFEVACKNCHYEFAVQTRGEREIDADGEDVTARCPLCGTAPPDNEFRLYQGHVHGGDKILVNKFILKHEAPERFDVIVFKFPREPWKNYIKRLIGLPGETIRIDERGDLRVKEPGASDFVLVRKPRRVQEELWMPVADARWPDPHGSPWKPDSPARWDLPRGHDGSERLVASPGKDDAWIDYGRTIEDAYGYDRPWSNSLHKVGDFRVRASVTATSVDTKRVRVALLENGRSLVAELPVGSGDGTAVLASDGRELARAPLAALRPGHPSPVALGYADERCTLMVDGAEVLSWDDPAPFKATDTASVRLGCGPGGASFTNVAIDRDIYYVPYRGDSLDPRAGPVELPADSYFMMGDNSPNSADSRDWGFVREPLLVGRAFLVWWPLDRVKLIR